MSPTQSICLTATKLHVNEVLHSFKDITRKLVCGVSGLQKESSFFAGHLKHYATGFRQSTDNAAASTPSPSSLDTFAKFGI